MLRNVAAFARRWTDGRFARRAAIGQRTGPGTTDSFHSPNSRSPILWTANGFLVHEFIEFYELSVAGFAFVLAFQWTIIIRFIRVTLRHC